MKQNISADIKSLTSFEHLKQMETLEENETKFEQDYDEEASDLAKNECKSVGRLPNKDPVLTKIDSVKKQRDKEDIKSVEPEITLKKKESDEKAKV